jgi:hypothetical protein
MKAGANDTGDVHGCRDCVFLQYGSGNHGQSRLSRRAYVATITAKAGGRQKMTRRLHKIRFNPDNNR